MRVAWAATREWGLRRLTNKKNCTFEAGRRVIMAGGEPPAVLQAIRSSLDGLEVFGAPQRESPRELRDAKGL